MITLPARIDPCNPTTHAELRPFTLVQILCHIDAYNTAETAAKATIAAAERAIAPYLTTEGGFNSAAASPSVRELRYLMSLRNFEPIYRRFPLPKTEPYFTGIAYWREATQRLNAIHERLTFILKSIPPNPQ